MERSDCLKSPFRYSESVLRAILQVKVNQVQIGRKIPLLDHKDRSQQMSLLSGNKVVYG